MTDVRPWRSVLLAETIGGLEAELGAAWARLLAEMGVEAGSPEEAALKLLVVEDPAEHEWRVVDAALDRLECVECGSVLARGPVTCRRCAFHHDARFAAREVDRVDVPPGNEHAVRVAFAVARGGRRYNARVRAGFELSLPLVVAGELPTTRQAQAARALLDRLTPEECERVTTFGEVAVLARGR
ncbi:hypothetical protein [Phytomonospora endophytica]|uniref:Uncharacterized protein n=1 Tax=Phytomonospora endophytica TaxID=714109 RepID=A0A841FPZ1_9ACTN|nr:hypothetical protein [Phytomonospora endophytica]MBB6036903.1 hypothetical protein [Phytomonospora endophytica]GIG68065.1 hypothetical protein Pen01_43600 [Phytomonospora endophytica]